jgi:cell division protein FtsW (lipid II flippase)
MFLNIALQKRDIFYKLSVLGLGLIYGFQMFLTIGGVTKFIPLTGVTLPLVSYGGTSVLMTLIMFSLIQGIHMIRENTGMPEQDINDEKD